MHHSNTRLTHQLHMLISSVALWCVTLISHPFTSGGVSVAEAEPTHQEITQDARLKRWSKMFRRGDRLKLLKAIEADLVSASPHPYASTLWVDVHQALGEFSEAWIKVKQGDNPQLKRALERTATLELLYDRKDYLELIKQFPLERLNRENAGLFDYAFLMWALDNTHNHQARLNVILAALQRWPDQFTFLWDLSESWRDELETDEASLKRIASTVEEGGILHDRPGGQFIMDFMHHRPFNTLDQVTAIKRFIGEESYDYKAYRFLGYRLETLGRYEEAVEALKRCDALYPFVSSCLMRIGKLAAHLKREDQLKSVVKSLQQRFSPHGAPVKVERDAWRVSLLREAGELGEARSLAEPLLKEHPQHERLLSDMAQIEKQSGRHRQATKLYRRLFSINPKSSDYLDSLLEELRASGQLEEAWSVYEGSVQSVPGTIWVRHEALEILLTQARMDEALEYAHESTQIYPQSAWMLRRLAEVLWRAKQSAEAVKTLNQAFDLDIDSVWMIQDLVKWEKERDQETRLATRLEELIARYPWRAKLWSERAKLLKQGDEKVKLWKRAVQLNPQTSWSAAKLLDEFATQGDWESLMKHADELLRRSESWTKGERTEALRTFAWSVRRRTLKMRVSPKLARRGIKALNDYLKLGASVGDYYWNCADLYNALGEGEEAARLWIKALELGVIDPMHYTLLFQRYTQSERFDRFWWMKRHIDRNPYDGERLSLAAHYHNKWGGSPIVALSLHTLVKERDPNHHDKVREANALGRLGAHAHDFEIMYGRADNIKNSERYIDWYESSRRKAQGESKRVILDTERTQVTILAPDGGSMVRRDHPITGKVVSLRRGASFVEFTYDKRGKNLQSITDSSGVTIKLTYNKRDQIKLLITPSDTLSFEYNERGKPTLINVKGVGELRVTYDESGEISRTEGKSADGEEGGHRIALRVSSAFRRLMSSVQHPAQLAQRGRLPELPFKDQKLETLEEKLTRAEMRAGQDPKGGKLKRLISARLTVIQHLVKHVQRSDRYRVKALRLIEEQLQQTRRRKLIKSYLQATRTWYELMLRVHPYGLGVAELKTWTTLRGSVERLLTDRSHRRHHRAARALLKAVEAKPLKLTPASRWLPRSHLSIPGYWRRYSLASALPAVDGATPSIQSVVVRARGDVVVGTDHGLSVLRRGFWERFVFNSSTSRFVPATPNVKGRATSNVLSLTEDAEGRLWVGTAKGLIIISGDYHERARRIISPEEGLPSSFVTHLMHNRAGVWVGTTRGVSRFEGGSPDSQRRVIIGAETDAGAEVFSLSDLDGQGALVSNRHGLFALHISSNSSSKSSSKSSSNSLSEARKLSDQPVKFATYHRGIKRVITQLPDQRFITLDPQTGGEPQPLDGAEDVVSSKQVYQAQTIRVDGRETTAILTDLGLSLYRDHHVEHFDLPHVTRRAGVRALSQRGGRIALVSSEGVYIYERDLARSDSRGRVYDILTLKDFTLIARGNRIERINHNTLEVSGVYRISAKHLRKNAQGQVITHDGTTVLSLDPETLGATELFEARQTFHPRWRQSRSEIRDLLVARDGSIWAVAGASLTRYHQGEIKEYGFFLDPEAFPSNSQKLARVIETLDGEIWTVASNEGHLSHNGVTLRGGLLKWNPDQDRFHKLKPKPEKWFITGYTQIDKNTALVGTLAGFARHRYGQLKPESSPSYKAMIKDHPLAWYSSRGVEIAKGWWLFGTAGGVVGYHEGQWFYPDRLNWMLPEQELSQYGGRHTYAVSVDPKGRIYVGTNQGLMIYEGSEGDPSSFLLSNGLTQQAFSDHEAHKLQETADVLLGHVDAGSTIARTAEQLREIEREIETAEQRLALLDDQRMLMIDRMSGAQVTGSSEAGEGAVATAETPVDREAIEEKLKSELKTKRKTHADLLLKLEREDPSLYQMLEFKPLDLVALRRDLGPDDLVLQYLPSRGELYVQLVTRSNEPEVREVKVSRDELFRRSAFVARRLGGHLARERDRERGARGAKRIKQTILSRIVNQDGSTLNSELAWLYDKLLRPVEHEASRYKRIYLVTTGPLAYVPFEALIRREKPLLEYAVKHFNFSYLPSLYLFKIMQSNVHAGGESDLIFADPDGSLPGARSEAGEVAKLLGARAKQLIGKSATHNAFMTRAPESRFLHLATHGVLNQHRPERSYLLLADKRRVTVPEIMTLSLPKTEMAVLSACESGVGVNGLEYATLARAFMHAGVSSVIATLWQVEDKSSKELMRVFYERLKEGDDRITALTKAKRALIASDDEALHHPARWSPYILFGEP